MSGGQRRRLSWTCVRRDPETRQDTFSRNHLSEPGHIMSINDAAGVLVLSPCGAQFATSRTLEKTQDMCDR